MHASYCFYFSAGYDQESNGYSNEAVDNNPEGLYANYKIKPVDKTTQGKAVPLDTNVRISRMLVIELWICFLS